MLILYKFKKNGVFMMIIRKLQYEDMAQAIKLKIICWPEEIAGLSNIQLDFNKEYDFWTQWMNTAEENNDVRLLYGIFSDNEMLGVAFGSFVDSKDIPESGFELNGLWISPQHRGKGVSLKLLQRLLDDFNNLGAKKIIIYNFHFSSSNKYYRKFGCTVINTEYQTSDNIPVDIFSCNIVKMKNNIIKSLVNYEK